MTAAEKKGMRNPRADGVRNRELLLETAWAMFHDGQVDAPLDEIAQRAGVGIGTFYRHFPNRDALIEAVYRQELTKLAAAAETFGATLSPVEALRAWMSLFVDYIAAKQVIAPALNAMVGGTGALYAESGEILKRTIDRLARRAIDSGELRGDLEPLDLLRALAGVANTMSAPGWEASARRLIDILIKGLMN